MSSRLSDLGLAASIDAGGSTTNPCVVEVDSMRSLETLGRLREDESLEMRRLVDLTAVDLLGRASGSGERFRIVYQLQSPTNRQRLRVEVRVAGEEPTIDSVVKLWPAARWLEREVFDLFGIRFRGHSELRRILLDAEFEGAPLRKDHPLRVERTIPGALAEEM